MTIIETQRLFLREMNVNDYDALYAVLADREIMQHYPYIFDEERVKSGRLEWEIPAGRIETGETREEAAKREAMEETGCTLKDIKFLCSNNPANGMSDLVLHVFAAKVETEDNIQDADEVAEKVWIPIDDVKRLLKNNQTMDGVSILAILFALEYYDYNQKFE